ncbi:hypothetical protein SK128_016349 [Halocaridina rubra]|uniref:Uncharacterized protein n=1 Tax=Halocaridina rubra TaxID=373956 RepID=A0AAN8WNL2_HALRR
MEPARGKGGDASSDAGRLKYMLLSAAGQGAVRHGEPIHTVFVRKICQMSHFSANKVMGDSEQLCSGNEGHSHVICLLPC